MKAFILPILLFLCSSLAVGQTYNIKGNVKEAPNSPMTGVSIVVKGTTHGTSTDIDGNFVLNNVKKGEVLVFSYVGYLTQELTINNGNPLNITLKEDTQTLSEVVVIGYGTQKKKDVTGSVSIVDAQTITDLKPIDAATALQGTTSGVSVNKASGSPGGKINILIRGVSSNGSNEPLVIIDGYEGALNSINPEDIESLTVLKDAQAAIYGIKGANGVVLVTTKGGRKNTPLQVKVSSYAGMQQTTKRLDYMNATEYAALLNESYAANGQALPFSDLSSLGKGINWQNEVFKNSAISELTASISGGSENLSYYLGASHLTQDGIVAPEQSNFKRNNVKVSLATDITPTFKLNFTANYYNNGRKTIEENGLGAVLFNALNFSPTYKLHDEDLTGFLGNEVINPLSQIKNTYNQYDGNGLEGNFQLSYNPLEGLNITSRIGFKTYADESKNFQPVSFFGTGKVFNRSRSTVIQTKNESHAYTWETFATYQRTLWDDHNTSLTVGTSAQRNWGSGLSATGYDVPNNSWDFADIALTTGTADTKTNSSYLNDSRLTSFFGRLQYDYKSKYLLSAMLRRDASSDFPKDNRADLFSSLTAGWKISDEDFLKDNKTINFLKLRGSYGTLGNNTGQNLYKAILNGEAVYVFNGQIVRGTAVGKLPNPSAKWEVAEKLDLGFDLNTLNNRLSVVFDYFVEKRNDLLIANFPVSGIIGTAAPGASNPTVNAGNTQNKGFEIALGYKSDTSKNFSYSINYNLTRLKGKVVGINGEVIPEGGAFSVGQLAPARMEVGQPIGYFYGLQADGIFQNQAEVDAHPSQIALGANAQPGDIRYKDLNGDGVINYNDRTYLGKPTATYYMGLNLNAKYKNFDFSTYMYAELDKEMVRNYERSQPNVNRHRSYLNRWHGAGTSNTVPRVTTGATTNNVFSSFFVEDASFLRIQNVQLGYSLPNSFLDNVKVKTFRIYLSVNNAFTFTHYKGYDPSATSGEAIGGGIDYGFYPQARQFILGFNTSF